MNRPATTYFSDSTAAGNSVETRVDNSSLVEQNFSKLARVSIVSFRRDALNIELTFRD